jgi:hypothetical protein
MLPGIEPRPGRKRDAAISTELIPDPSGFSRTTFQQIEAADKKLFILLAERTRSCIEEDEPPTKKPELNDLAMKKANMTGRPKAGRKQ